MRRQKLLREVARYVAIGVIALVFLFPLLWMGLS